MTLVLLNALLALLDGERPKTHDAETVQRWIWYRADHMNRRLGVPGAGAPRPPWGEMRPGGPGRRHWRTP